MLKKRSKAISMLVVLAFLFTMILPGMAFAADPVKITNSTKQGVVEDNEEQASLGFVKFTDLEIEDCDYIQIEIELPADVDWDKDDVSGDGAVGPTVDIDDCIMGYYADPADGDGVVNDPITVTTEVFADADEYVVRFEDVTELSSEGAYIKAEFDGLLIQKGAPDDIYATVNVIRVEDDVPYAPITEECLIGCQGDSEVTVSVADAKSVTKDTNQEIAKITVEENLAGVLLEDDKFIFSLPDKFEWDTDLDDYSLKIGKYGLEVALSFDDGDLVATVEDIDADGDCTSATFADEFSFKGLVTVFPGAPDGDVEVDVEAVFDDPDSEVDCDDPTLIVAYVGDTALTLDVEDTADDSVYQADFGKEVDDITMEASGNFADGDKFSVTLSDGAYWYMTEGNFSAIDDITCLGLYDDNQSAWLQIDDDTDEITLDGLMVGTYHDCPMGDIVVTFDGDYEAEAVVGEVIAVAEVTADTPIVSLATLGAPAGDITIVETKKKSIPADGVIKLDLPTGVYFSSEPTVEVNGEEPAALDVELIDDDEVCQIDLAGMKTNKIDTIVISDIEYDMDTRVKGTEISISIKGSAVNFIGDAAFADAKAPEDFQDDYKGKTVLSVVNGVSQDPGAADSVFTIGVTTYTINGVEYSLDVAPYISGSRTYLPVRFVAYALGITDANILWNQDLQTVTLMKGDKVVQLAVGSTSLLINGATVTMDVAPELTADRVCLPIRFVAQAFGAQVGWDAATQQVTVEL